MSEISESQKDQASIWFMALRDEIVQAFEHLEAQHSEGPFSDHPIGQFDVTTTRRHSDSGKDAGGGLMSVMRGGRVFEKVGVNVSTVFGPLGPLRGRVVTELGPSSSPSQGFVFLSLYL